MNTVGRLAALASLILVATPAGAAEPPELPNPIVTPGAVDPAATREVICNGRTRDRRHVTAAEKVEVLDAYEIDHLVPLAICGANTVANLWPEP